MAKIHILLIVFWIIMFGGILQKVVSHEEYTFPETIEQLDTLTEWQIFIMALIEIECERDPTTVSNKGAVGPLQITQIYIDDINRIYKTSFILDDAYNLDLALTMFEMINDHYNPDRDINRAIKLHNPGAGKWYEKRIKDRIHLIKFNEYVRYKLLELYNTI